MNDLPSSTRPGVIDPDYLPFTVAELRPHFAPIKQRGSVSPSADRHVAYYLAGAKAASDYAQALPLATAAQRAQARRRGRQIEKDERFWVVSGLMSLFHAPDRKGTLTQALARCGWTTPPFTGFPTWAEALGDPADLRLYFEVNLPSPLSYRTDLRDHLDTRVLIPYVRSAAKKAGLRLEGATKVDAMLLAPETGVAVMFEAKVLSDISGGVEFDVLRNQLARNLDVMLDTNAGLVAPLAQRDPDRTCLALLTPEIFREHPESKLYGVLLNLYREQPDRLRAALPHRSDFDAGSVASRLGWLTWEDLNRVVPTACGWLDGRSPTPRQVP